MIRDPYSVLGIEKGATKEEIKKAYRQKAKEYHPDLHPNDPHAAEKMNEVNEAYDMLSNPEKYQQRAAQTGYGGTGQGYGNTSQSYGNANQSGRQGYGGSGWSSHSSQGYEEYDPFGFGDWFGFGQRSGSIEKPTANPDDSNEIRQVIDFIYMGNYRYARQVLNTMVSAQRNGRWYYLSAVTNHGLGNTIEAIEHIRKAILLEPNNLVYQKVMQDMQQSGQQYNSASEAYGRYTDGMTKMCRSLCFLHCMCMWCC